MRNLLKFLTGSSTDDDVGGSAGRLRTLELELADRDRRLAELETELRRLRESQQQRVHESVDSRLDAFFSDAAAPVAQLLTQIFLLEHEGMSIDCKDMARLIKKLVRSLQESGMEIVGEIGQPADFDPNRHEPLSSEDSLSSGEVVQIRVPGLAYGGRIIRKAGVKPAGG